MRTVVVAVTQSIQRSGDNERKSAPSIINFYLQKEKAATLLVFLTVYHAQVLSS
jgi:hypothetical protein